MDCMKRNDWSTPFRSPLQFNGVLTHSTTGVLSAHGA